MVTYVSYVWFIVRSLGQQTDTVLTEIDQSEFYSYIVIRALYVQKWYGEQIRFFFVEYSLFSDDWDLGGTIYLMFHFPDYNRFSNNNNSRFLNN